MGAQEPRDDLDFACLCCAERKALPEHEGRCGFCFWMCLRGGCGPEGPLAQTELAWLASRFANSIAWLHNHTRHRQRHEREHARLAAYRDHEAWCAQRFRDLC